MNCKNHQKTEAVGSCVNCGNLFCKDCLIKSKHKNYCKECAIELLGDKELKKKEPMVVQQQQQQQQQKEPINKNWFSHIITSPKSINALKWIIGFFTILLSFGVFKQHYFLGFIILLILGLYWLPPIQNKATTWLKEKYDFETSTPIKIIVSVVLFIIGITIPF